VTVRNLRPDDIPKLEAMQGEFPYPNVYELEAIRIVVDDHDQPVMACGAKKLLELYLWQGPGTPLAKLHALRLLHEDLAVQLRQKGYHSVEAFLPPPVATRFARRLVKSFGWKLNWPSWTRSF